MSEKAEIQNGPTEIGDKKGLLDQQNHNEYTPEPVLTDKHNNYSQKEKEANGEGHGLLEDGKVLIKPLDESQAPNDRFLLVYLIMMLNGVAILMPWNMFITATGYFTEKLSTKDGKPTEYKDNFLSYLGIAAQLPNVILNLINVFAHCGAGSLSLRIIVSIIIVLLMFIVTVILAMVDSSGWPGTFFAITMVTVVIINMANGVYQNCVYGMAAGLPMKYTNAVVLGSNLSGTITSVVAILSLAFAPTARTAAIYYFLSAIFMLLVAFDTYFALPLIPFFRFYKQRAEAHHVDMPATERARPPFLKIFKQSWVQCLSVFCVFFVTLTCFPAIMADIESTEGLLTEKYYTPVTCFLFFNTFAMFGNLATEVIKKPGPRWVWLPVVLRLLFIPFFMLCNFRPYTRSIPILIGNDYVYIVGVILMAFTSGYFSSLTMMYAPGKVEPQHQGIAGMMAAFFLILGIFGGVNFSLVIAKIATFGAPYYEKPLANGTLSNVTALPALADFTTTLSELTTL